MKHNFLLLFCILIIPYCRAQTGHNRENIWAFSAPGGLLVNGKYWESVGLDFNQPSRDPRLTITRMNTSYSAASICDHEGNLLFYTNGYLVWDRRDSIMQNGEGIVPIPVLAGFPDFNTHSSCIVPFPDNKDKYYVFSITHTVEHNDDKGKLFYSVVDMKLNGGLGGIDTENRGILLDSGLGTHLSAVVGENCNIWLLVCALNHDIKAYEIGLSGLKTSPVVSKSIGPGVDPIYPDFIYSVGVIRPSADRKSLVMTQQGFLTLGDYGADSAAATLYDFDPASGLVSNPLKLLQLGYNEWTGESTTAYGACFSPDNSKLYINYGEDLSTNMQIVQFDLSNRTPAAILSSQYTLGPNGMASDIKQGPDGKLYFFYTSPSGLGTDMGSISQPNLAGPASQFLSFAFALRIPDKKNDGNWGYGLPNVVPVLVIDTLRNLDTVVVCFGDEKIIGARDTLGRNYYWSNGASGITTTLAASGKYWVRYRSGGCDLSIDTFVVEMVNLERPVITIDTFTLIALQDYDSYQWLLNNEPIAGATGKSYKVNLNGRYRVIVTGKSGCRDTSEVYPVTNVSTDEVVPLAQSINVYPNPAQDKIYFSTPVPLNALLFRIEGQKIAEQKQVSALSLSGLPKGIYILYLTDSKGTLLKVEKVVKLD